MDQPRKSELYYEEIGEDFDKFMSSYDVDRRIHLIMDKLIPAGEAFGTALEVGCGTGRISERLVGRTGRLTVSDISAKLAAKVGARLNCDSRQQDACALTFPDNTFDLVVSSECVEHTPDPWKALDEMVRVARPGGVVVVTTPNKVWYPSLIVAQLLKIRKYEGNEIWISPWRTTAWIRARGLEPLRLGGCHLAPWILPGAKAVLPFFDKFDRLLWRGMINLAFAVRKPPR